MKGKTKGFLQKWYNSFEEKLYNGSLYFAQQASFINPFTPLSMLNNNHLFIITSKNTHKLNKENITLTNPNDLVYRKVLHWNKDSKIITIAHQIQCNPEQSVFHSPIINCNSCDIFPNPNQTPWPNTRNTIHKIKINTETYPIYGLEIRRKYISPNWCTGNDTSSWLSIPYSPNSLANYYH